MANLTPEQIKELRELCEKATPGPWEMTPTSAGYLINSGDQRITSAICYYDDEGFPTAEPCVHGSEAQFIAAARTAMPQLIAEVKRLREALDFYANNDTYDKTSDGNESPDFGCSIIAYDSGKLARNALGYELGLTGEYDHEYYRAYLEKRISKLEAVADMARTLSVNYDPETWQGHPTDWRALYKALAELDKENKNEKT